MTTLAVSPAVTSPSTRRLLLGGAAAAVLFPFAVLGQAATRAGYDLTRHPASVLANGDLGWVQTVTFLACGVLTIGGAVGFHRALGSRALTVLLTIQGLGLIVAGIFPMDPVDGFPVGTPAGVPTSMSGTAVLHNVGGSLSFLALIVACFVLARRCGAGWAWVGRAAGLTFTAGLVWAMTGGAAGALTLFVGVTVAWGWVAATAVRLAR